jgi:hypothetical protein
MVAAVRAVGCTAGSLLLVAAVVVGAARLWVAAAVMMVVVTNWVERTRAVACRTQNSTRKAEQSQVVLSVGITLTD